MLSSGMVTLRTVGETVGAGVAVCALSSDCWSSCAADMSPEMGGVGVTRANSACRVHSAVPTITETHNSTISRNVHCSRRRCSARKRERK